jgi:hypothetical protein
MRAIGPATNICHQNAAQKFTGHTEAKRNGNSTSGVPAKISPITLIASDIPVTMHTVRASAWASVAVLGADKMLHSFLRQIRDNQILNDHNNRKNHWL